MNISPPQAILTEQELQTPRTAADMLAWVHGAHARFDTKALRAEAREGKHFARVLLDEAFPMALFANRYYGASALVTVTHVLGNQNYDGTVADGRPQSESYQFLEVTTTLVTYEESLRMELLSQQGFAPGYGQVSAIGPKHKRVAIAADGDMQDHEKIVAEHLSRAENAVLRKAKKKYQPNTVLVVAVDDSVPFRDNADVDALDALANATLLPALKGTNFTMLALEGSTHVHLCYKL